MPSFLKCQIRSIGIDYLDMVSSICAAKAEKNKQLKDYEGL